MKRNALKYAFPYTLPICAGFLFLGMSYGFFASSKGFSFIYPLFMSMFIFAGSMEFPCWILIKIIRELKSST